MDMIVEWCRPTSYKDYLESLLDVLEPLMPQKYPITISNFSGYYHAKILGLIDSLLKMREMFGAEGITPKMRNCLPADGWGTDSRPGYIRLFFAALGKRHYTRVLNICGGKEKMKEFTVLSQCFRHIEDVLQEYRTLCVDISKMHDDMEPSTRIDGLFKHDKDRSNMSPYEENDGKIVKYGSKFPPRDSKTNFVSRFNAVDDLEEPGADDSMLSDSENGAYSDKIVPLDGDRDSDDNDSDNFNHGDIYDDMIENDIVAMSQTLESERTSRTAIKDIFRGYCVAKLVYGTCAEGAKCYHCHSSAGRSLCLSSVKMIADQRLSDHGLLKEYCEDVDPDYKKQVLARSPQRPAAKPNYAMKQLEAPPKFIPKALQRNVNFKK
jgi:hypothetical protein